MLCRVWVWLLAVLFAALPCASFAQETTGRLEGRVLDATGAPIPEVNVTVTSPALQGGRGCLTSVRGTFVLLALPVGEYRVKLAHLAYQAQVVEQMRVRLGQTTSLGDVRLGDAVLDQPEIVVSGKRPLVDLSSTDIGGVLAAKEFAPLPLERDYRSAVVLLPQANVSYLGDPVNFAGATGLENRYFIDGVDVTDPWRFNNATSLPYNLVEEVEVRTGGYEAQYRSALGGTVNAITFSGGNQVTGQVFGYYTENRPTADARYRLRPETSDFALYDVGIGIGGPILRDRLWYYLSYNPTVTTEDVPVQGWGSFEDKAITHSLATKLTWRANDKNSLLLKVLGDPTERRAVNAPWYDWLGNATLATPDPALQRIDTGSLNAALEGRHSLSDKFLLESSFSAGMHRQRSEPDGDPSNAAMPFTDMVAGVVSGSAGAPEDRRNDVLLARLAGTWWTSRHEVKAGFEYKGMDETFGSGGSSLTLQPDSTWVYHASGTAGRAGNRIYSAFLQDGWRVTDRVRLNLGLRWEAVYIISTEREVAQIIPDEWQPRLGLTWNPDGRGIQKLSASFGRFYHDIPLWPHMFFFNNSNWDSAAYYSHDPRLDPSAPDTVLGSPYGSISGYIQPPINDLQGQYYDEFSLAFERQLGRAAKLGVRGVLRNLGMALEDGCPDTTVGSFVWGNPGRGLLGMYPKATRRYSALELTWQQQARDRLSLLVSYVLSRNYGNYPGLSNTDFGWDFPNANGSFDMPFQLPNGEGWLPNDRTHVFKLSGSYRIGAGLTLGAIGMWASGAPLSRFGDYPYLAWVIPEFLQQRGTAGHTPSVWDLNARVGYLLPHPGTSRLRPKLTLDLLHIASQERPVTFDQMVYFMSYDSGQGTWSTLINPNYGQPTQWQPAMAARIGAEIQF